MTVPTAIHSSVKSYKDFVRSRLNDLVGDLIPVDSENGQILTTVLSNHPRWDEKAGDEAVSYQVGWNFRSDGPCVFLVYEDGSEADISWVKACAEGFRRQKLTLEQNHRQRVISAARRTVEDQMSDFKQSQRSADGTWVSDLSGSVIAESRFAHVDHNPVSFITLLDTFIDTAPLRGQWEAIEVADAGLAGGWDFTDETLAQRWWQYHRDHARLRILTQTENLTKLKK